VEDLPSELQAVRFERHPPVFADGHVPASESVAPEDISGSITLAGKRMIEVIDSGRGICEHTDGSVPQRERTSLWPRGDLCEALEIPIRCPVLAIVNAKREAGSPSRQTGDLPATDECIRDSPGAASKTPARTERQFHDPVGIDLMGCIKIRHGAGVPW